MIMVLLTSTSEKILVPVLLLTSISNTMLNSVLVGGLNPSERYYIVKLDHPGRGEH